MTLDQALQQGFAHHRAGRLAEAEQLYRQVLAAAPDHPGALVLLAEIALQCGHGDAAIQLARRAVQVDPVPERFTSLGAMLRALGRLPEAEQAFRSALAQAPNEPAAHCNLASVLWQQRKLPEARTLYQQALQLDSEFPVALHGLMAVAGDQGEFELAADAGRQAEKTGYTVPRFWSDFAIALNDIGDLNGAVAAAERAVALDPQNATLRFNLSQLLLLNGDFALGWQEHEHRWGSAGFPSPIRNFTQPMWDGTTAPDRTVLLHAEQGFGDAIMFARYIPLVAQRARVIVECQPEVTELMRTVPGAERVIARGDDLGLFDYHAPFLSLPLIFQTRLETIPANVPYVSAPPDRVAAWKQRLAPEPRLRVGLAWAGAPTHLNDANRSTSFAMLAPLRNVTGVAFYSLQKGPRSADAAGADWITDWTSELSDFSGTAALIENLDLVISVDTSIVHVAGALAKPTWVMLPFAPDWRWLRAWPDKSPWYPTMKLFRQNKPRAWDEVVQRVASDLRQMALQT